MVFIN